MRRRLIRLASAVMILAVVAPPAAAWPFAPELVESTPLDEERLHSAPTEVSLEFSEEIDADASTLEVRNECGRRVDAEAVEVSGTTVSTEVEGDFKGSYTVRYEATGFGTFSGTATGEFSFTVHFGSTCGRVRGSGQDDRGGSGKPSDNSENGDSPGNRSGDSPSEPGSDPHHTSSTTDPRGTSSSSDRSDSATDTTDDSGSFGDDASTAPPPAAPTPVVTPTPLPTLTPAPAPTADEPDQELTLTASPQPGSPADGADVLIALSLVVMLGVLGGWVLRASAPR